MKLIATIFAALLLVGCDKMKDNFSTAVDGYVVRCIDGTKYVLVSTDRGQAITPHLGTDGKPKGCSNG